jgi:concanavalin A-like lectin/glucanase superfamily protein
MATAARVSPAFYQYLTALWPFSDPVGGASNANYPDRCVDRIGGIQLRPRGSGTVNTWAAVNIPTQQAGKLRSVCRSFSQTNVASFALWNDATTNTWPGQLMLRPSNESFSFSVWVNPTDFANGRVVLGRYNTSSNQRGWRLRTNGATGQMIWEVSEAGTTLKQIITTSGTGLLTAAAWNHVACNFSLAGQAINLWVNGVMQTPTTCTTVFAADLPAYFEVGRGGDSTLMWLGGIEQLAYWRGYAITQGDVDYLFADGMGRRLT